MKGKHIEVVSRLPKPNAAAIVEKLLADMHAAVKAGNVLKYESLSDQLAVFSRAYVVPSVTNMWEKYGLTPAETVMAELLHTKLNQNVRRTSLMDALYFGCPDDEPDIKIVDVRICRIRKKIANSPYRIVNVWGHGYSMVDANSSRQNDRTVAHKSAA